MGRDAWADVTLGEFVTLQRGHDLPDQDRRHGTVPILGSFGVTGWHDVAKARGPGVTVGRSGASFGVVAFSEEDFWPLNTALYVIDFHGNDERFAYYFLKNFDFSGHNSGSAQPSLNRNYIHPLPVQVPPLAEQRAIARILGALDDKIELNRKMNATLEAMARALFKSWFVDFDPVRAKAEGRAPSGIDAETAKMFPSEFVDSGLGPIPKGWRVDRLDELASVVMGLSPSGDSYNSDGVGTPLINGPVEFGEYFPEKSKWTTEAARLSEVDDLIFCVRGSTTGRRVVADGPYALGRGVCAIRPDRVPAVFLYQVVEQELARLLAKATGSVFPSLSAPDIKGFQVVRPTNAIVRPFGVRGTDLLRRQQQNHREGVTLARLRDTLLPRLLSGELPVDAAEHTASEVA